MSRQPTRRPAVSAAESRGATSAARVDAKRLIFVGGLHRSGTTPLSRVLAGHPDISGLRDTGVIEDEGQHLQSVYPPASTYGGPGRFALDARAHLTEASPLVSAESARQMWASWEPYWDMSRPLLLEKSPPNMVMGRFLQAMFPGSALIVVVRHPVVVALSTYKWRRLLSRHWWNHASLYTMVGHWFRAHEILRQDAAHLSRLRLVRYEDLMADPEAELARIQHMLGLEGPVAAGAWRTGHNERYESRWADMADGLFSRRIRRAIERDFADAAADYGYDISDPRHRSTWSVTDWLSTP